MYIYTYNVHEQATRVSVCCACSVCCAQSAFLSVIGHSIQPLFGLLCCDVYEHPVAVCVVFDRVVDWNTGVVLEDVYQFRIVGGPWWRLVVD